MCRGIVCLHRGAWLRVAEFDEGLSYGDGGFCIDSSTVHRRHRHRCRCPQAATTTTATIACPLVMPFSHPLIVLSLRCPLIVSSCRLVVASPLVALPSCRPLTTPPSRHLALAGCCIASRHATLLSSCRASLSSFCPHSHAHTCSPPHPASVS
jgi:hypothetical protein